MRRLIAISLALLVAALVVNDGALATALGAISLVVAGIAWFEGGTDSTRELAVVATLAAGAAAGRVLFAADPGRAAGDGDRDRRRRVARPARRGGDRCARRLRLEPVPRPGNLDAAADARLGPCGAVGALLGPALRSRWALAAVGAVLGFAFSMSMDVWLWYGFAPHTLPALVGGARARPLVRHVARRRQRRDRARCRAGAAADARPLRLAPADGGRVGLAPLLAALLLAVSPVSFVQSHAAGGAYAEPGGTSDALLTSWAVLGLRAAGAASPGSLAYLQSQEPSLQTSNDVAIVALAEQALGDRNEQLLARLHVLRERADRRDAQLDLLGRARPRPLVARDDAVHARAADARRAGSRGSRTARPTRTTRRPRSRRSASRASTAGRSRGRSGSCAASSGPTEASS